MSTRGPVVHPFHELFAQLTRLMSTSGYPVRHDFGTQADAEHTSVDRVVWIPGAVGSRDMPFTLPNDDIAGQQTCAFQVSLYAGSYLHLVSLHSSLGGNLDVLQGPPQGAPPSQDGTRPYRPGYTLGESSPGPRGGDATARGWGMIVPVTLYAPMRSTQSPLAPIQRVLRRSFAEGADGATPELATETG
jgi:hypothetical protein